MNWFNILKGNVYYHVTAPEYAQVIMENQSIPVEQKLSNEPPWQAEQFPEPYGTAPGLYKLGEPRHIFFWKDLDEAKLWEKHNRFSNDDTKTVILRAEIDVKLKKWPRDVLVHTPKQSGVPGPLLKSGYAYFGDEDIAGNFEVIQ
jgi:hypothetical protein